MWLLRVSWPYYSPEKTTCDLSGVLAAKKRISSLSDIKTTPYLIALLLSSDMFRYPEKRFILLRNYRDLYVFDAELNSIKHLRFAGVNTNNGSIIIHHLKKLSLMVLLNAEKTPVNVLVTSLTKLSLKAISRGISYKCAVLCSVLERWLAWNFFKWNLLEINHFFFIDLVWKIFGLYFLKGPRMNNHKLRSCLLKMMDSQIKTNLLHCVYMQVTESWLVPKY